MKHQTPGTKSQISSPAYRQAGMTEIQISMQMSLGHLELGIENCLGFGI